ncbi:MAG: glycosyltransferase [Ferruginibacter sp.]
MIIAINAVVPLHRPAAAGHITALAIQMAAAHPEHHFLLLGCDTGSDPLPSNCSIENSPQISSPIRFIYWLNYQLPALLRKKKASLLISYNSCSLRMKLPQLLITDDLQFLTHPEFYQKNWLRFYKKYSPLFLQKAAAISATSAFLQAQITEQYGIAPAKISVVHAWPGTLFKPAEDWKQQEAVKQKITGGKEFFLYSGPVYTACNLVYLLKAFSFFKQRQKSNMQLVLASTLAAEPAFIKSLASYKYRTDVVLAAQISTAGLAEITAAAYAVVYPPLYDAAGISPLQAIYCHTPVIASNTGALPELCKDAAVYCYPDDHQDIAAKMMLLFTNEDRRNRLIAHARVLATENGPVSPGQQTLQLALSLLQA